MSLASYRKRWSAGQTVRDSLYLLLSWPWLIGGFSVVITVMAVGLALTPFLVGLPILMAGAMCSVCCASGQRWMHRTFLDADIPTEKSPQENAADRGSLGGRVGHMLGEHAGDVILSLLGWTVCIVPWATAVAWWSTMLSELTAPIWVRAVGVHQVSDIVSLLGVGDVILVHDVVNVAIGLAMVLPTPRVMQTLAAFQSRLVVWLATGPGALVSARVRERRHAAQLAATRTAEAAAMWRLERDIHDGPQQRLVRLQLDLARAERVSNDPEKAQEIIRGARLMAQDALDELRTTTRGIAPQVLVEQGLAAACEEVAGRSLIPTRIQIDIPRMGEPVERALFYMVNECMTNALKHSGAAQIRITGVTDDDVVVIQVADDGRGGATVGGGSGLSGLQQRLAAVGGTLTVSSPAGGPTVVEGRVPCAS